MNRTAERKRNEDRQDKGEKKQLRDIEEDRSQEERLRQWGDKW